MHKLKLYLLSLLLFGIAVLLVLTAAELVLRWMTLAEAVESRDHTEATSYSPARLRAGYQGIFWGIPFRTNQYGLRDEPEFPLEPESGEFRVLSLGDSIGFGLGVEARDHYTKVAEQLLTERFPRLRVRVLNAGGQGYSPSCYLVWLRHEGIRLRPNLVVMETELCNDVTDEALLRWRKVDSTGVAETIAGGRYQVGWDGGLLGTYSIGSFGFERTYLYSVFIRRWLNLAERVAPQAPQDDDRRIYYSLGFDRYLLTPERIEEGWARLDGAVAGTASWLKSEGIPFLLMVMPSRYLYQNVPSFTGPAEAIYQRFTQVAEARGLNYLPMAAPIGDTGGAALFFDFAHLTVAGNAVVGRNLADRIAGFLPAPPAHDGKSPESQREDSRPTGHLLQEAVEE